MPIRKYKGIPSDGLFLSAVVMLVFIKISQKNGYCALIKRTHRWQEYQVGGQTKEFL